MIILVTGGSGSGKSVYAEDRICAAHLLFPYAPLIYLAAMDPSGAEDRIERHREQRRGKGFVTVERQTGFEQLDIPAGSFVLLECLGNLTANEMFSGASADTCCAERVMRGIDHIAEKSRFLCLVTNEIFSDGLSYSDETDMYMRALAKVNIFAAKRADEVVEVAAGLPVFVKGGGVSC